MNTTIKTGFTVFLPAWRVLLTPASSGRSGLPCSGNDIAVRKGVANGISHRSYKFSSYRARFVAQIGAGGMGEVYKAHDTKLGRDVAIEVLPEAFAHDPERLSHFQRVGGGEKLVHFGGSRWTGEVVTLCRVVATLRKRGPLEG